MNAAKIRAIIGWVTTFSAAKILIKIMCLLCILSMLPRKYMAGVATITNSTNKGII